MIIVIMTMMTMMMMTIKIKGGPINQALVKKKRGFFEILSIYIYPSSIKYIALPIFSKTILNIMEILIWTIIIFVLNLVKVHKSHF